MANKTKYTTLQLNNKLYELVGIMAYGCGLKIYTMANELIYRGIQDLMAERSGMKKYEKDLGKIDISEIRKEIDEKVK